MRQLVLSLCFVVLTGCAVSSHATQKSMLGVSRSSADLLAVIDQPGPVTIETVESCQWAQGRRVITPS